MIEDLLITFLSSMIIGVAASAVGNIGAGRAVLTALTYYGRVALWGRGNHQSDYEVLTE